MEEEQHQKREGPIPLDWNKLLPDEETPPPELVVKPSSSMTSDQSYAEDLSSCTDHELRESIRSKTKTLETMRKILNDGGARIVGTIDRLREELKRRELKRLHQEVDEDQKQQPKQDKSSSAVGEGVSNDLIEENISSQAQPQSTFASSFVKKIEDNTNCTAVDAFKKEMLFFKHCDNQTGRDNGEPRGRKRHRSSSRQLPKRATFSDDKTNRATSTLSLRNIERNLSRRYGKVNDASVVNQSDGSRSRKGQPIVLDDDDEEEPHIMEKTETKFAEYLKEAKIYFPSRDDPECVEICYTDTECLAPEGYLTSTIMNFYIRNLQQQESLSNRSLSDYHFFNTYFYKKLKEAVSCKQSDRELIFAKFRRWWKGVNIFQKAYVLIPIHEDLHWSLIIICIPDKEAEMGPIILHLDSLGLHSSKSVFDNIKNYLIEERNYMDREHMSSDVLIADRIWKCLPRRIESQIIAVPQQKNEYDCGLFVLYFIERFMEDAPERLRRKDLAMFGKRWFRPEEASSLRLKIRKLLLEKLQNSLKHNHISKSKSSPSSSPGNATNCVEVETANDSLA